MIAEIVEIGTSDFRTLAGKAHGLFVEPVPVYFHALPPCLKENVAVSSTEGLAQVYYIPPSVIEREKLPYWVRGCNSINEMHPTIAKMGWSQFAVFETIKVVRIKTLIDKHGIEHIKTLKIDTEGHDCVILNDFLDTCSIVPDVIVFEANVLSNENEVMKVVRRLTKIGYRCVKGKNDYRCEKL